MEIKYYPKAEYCSLWGEDVIHEGDYGSMLTADDVEMIALGWGKAVEDVIDQLDVYYYETAVAHMDDEIREAVNYDLAPCSEARFMWEYCKRHQEKFGEPFEFN